MAENSKSLTLRTLTSHLDELLEIHRYQDAALNGLQVESGQSEVRKVGVAVDACLETIQAAVSHECQLLIVHHGLFWGEWSGLVGNLSQRVTPLLRGECSLYASHLPLDGHLELGNAIEIGRQLGLERIEGFWPLGSVTLGIAGHLTRPTTFEELTHQIKKIVGVEHSFNLRFGPSEVSSVAVVTGSGSGALPLCGELGIELLVSGEPKHEAYHTAKELGVNAVFAGHYATEVFGIQNLASYIAENFGLETVFIDVPTGI